MRIDTFFGHIFRGVGFDEVPVITIHKGNDFWETRRWRPGDNPPTGRLYYCISTVRPGHPRAQIVSRRTEDLVKTYVIVLDDVGTKVDPKKILLQPSYKLETSPGNFQWGYLLTYGSDPAKAAALIQGLADAGLTDNGAKRGDRVVRVPGSLNDKYEAPFIARLVEEHWERTWTLSELELGFKVMAAEPRPAMDQIRALEAGETDPVFEWLVADDRVVEGPNPRGWYRIVCPWEHEHTTGDKGTDYAPGNPGAFSCLHGHCQAAGRNTAALKAWIREQDPDAVLERTMADVTAPLVAKLVSPKAGGRGADVLAGLAEQAKAWRLEQEAARPERAVEAPQAVEQAILADLIHVATKNEYWSLAVGGLMKHKAINDRYYTRMRDAGLLAYTVELASGKEKEKELAVDTWLKGHDDVRRAGKMTYRLGQPLMIDGDLNIAPELPEDLTHMMGDVGPWLDVVEFVCGDETDIVLDWLAMVVGTFSIKPGFHLLLRSQEQGAGKNLMMLPAVQYLKKAKLHQDVTVRTLNDTDTTFLQKRLCTVDEMKTTTRGSSTGHDMYNTIKAFTALGADTITVRALFLGPYEASNVSCWCLSSNETVPMPIEESDRRFLVIEAPSELMPKDWYQERGKWIEANYQTVVGWLQHRWDNEMTDEHKDALRRAPPMTQAKQDLIDSSASGIDGAVRFMIRDGELPDLVSFNDVAAKLAVTKNLPSSLSGQITNNRISDALKAAGARKLFKGEAVRGEGPAMRLWCVRGAKAAEYEALGHQGVRDAYAAQSGRPMVTGQKVVAFPSTPRTTPH
jgi:hypothetical protein